MHRPIYEKLMLIRDQRSVVSMARSIIISIIIIIINSSPCNRKRISVVCRRIYVVALMGVMLISRCVFSDHWSQGMSPPPHAVARMADGGRSKIQEVQIILILPLKLGYVDHGDVNARMILIGLYVHDRQMPRRSRRLRDAASGDTFLF